MGFKRLIAKFSSAYKKPLKKNRGGRGGSQNLTQRNVFFLRKKKASKYSIGEQKNSSKSDYHLSPVVNYTHLKTKSPRLGATHSHSIHVWYIFIIYNLYYHTNPRNPCMVNICHNLDGTGVFLESKSLCTGDL